jgi:hypothetical protein
LRSATTTSTNKGPANDHNRSSTYGTLDNFCESATLHEDWLSRARLIRCKQQALVSASSRLGGPHFLWGDAAVAIYARTRALRNCGYRVGFPEAQRIVVTAAPPEFARQSSRPQGIDPRCGDSSIAKHRGETSVCFVPAISAHYFKQPQGLSDTGEWG